MKLAEALSIVQKTSTDLPEFAVTLACGFTPLHLQNFLAAHVQSMRPDRKVRVSTGLYGDLAGTVEQLAARKVNNAAIVIEWQDLDPRLGYRQLGGWGQHRLADCVATVSAMLQRFENAIGILPPSSVVALSLPTLPLPPAFHTAGSQASSMELALAQAIQDFAVRVAARPAVRVVNRQKLYATSPVISRYDFRFRLARRISIHDSTCRRR